VNVTKEEREPGETTYIVAMESQVDLVKEELMKMKAVMEEIHIRMTQNQNVMELMRNKAMDNQSKLMELMTCIFSKRINEFREGSVGLKGAKNIKNSGRNSSWLKSLKGDELSEFRQLVKRIELPMFSGENLASWISRAEIYFKV